MQLQVMATCLRPWHRILWCSMVLLIAIYMDAIEAALQSLVINRTGIGYKSMARNSCISGILSFHKLCTIEPNLYADSTDHLHEGCKRRSIWI